MGFFCRIKRYFEDLWHRICECKWKAVLTSAVAIAGVAVGVALFVAFRYSWWYFNRCAFAEKLFVGGFSIFLLFVISAMLYYACIVLCNLIPQTRFINFVILFFAGFYCGANTAAVVESFTVWGVIYAILVALIELIGCSLASFLASCEPAACRRLKESWCDFRASLQALVVCLITKIFTFFIILKLLTAVI